MEAIFRVGIAKRIPTKYGSLRCKRFEGEVALAWNHWKRSPEALPRNSLLWNSQYAISAKYAGALSRISPSNEEQINESVDLLAVGNTTILRSRKNEVGHWRLNGGAITLGQLLVQIGKDVTVCELMLWYHKAPKVARKRPHPWGSDDARASAHERFKAYGRRVHRD